MKTLMIPDAGPKVGLGHVTRLLSVGQSLRQDGARITFSLTDRLASRLITDSGFTVVPVWEQADLAVVDSYRFQRKDFKRLSAVARHVAHIDDLNKAIPGVDLIVRPHPGPKRVQAHLVEGHPYIPLRKEFWRHSPHPIRQTVRCVFIGLGAGVSMAHLTRTARIVRSVLPKARIVVPGSYRLSKRLAFGIRPHHPHASMRRQLASADLAVAAGGQTLLELLSVGIPTIGVESAANQRRNLRFSQKREAIIYGGRLQAGSFDRRLSQLLARAADDAALRQRLSRNAQKLINGKGAHRVARVLWSLVKESQL